MLTEYETFKLIIETGSLSAAARELGLATPIVSKRLARLEDRLGVRLIERTTRRLAPTESGRQFYERVRSILDAAVEAEALVSGRNNLARGLLRVSAPTAFGRQHLAPHLKTFLNANANVTLELNLTDAFVDLASEGVDVAVRITTLNEDDPTVTKLAPNRRVLCAAPSYLDEHGEPADLADLRRHRLITAANQSSWRLEGPEGLAIVHAHSYLRTNSSEVVREAVLSGLGIGVRSTWDVSGPLAAGSLRIVLPQYSGASDVGVYAVTAARRSGSPSLVAFIDFLSSLYNPKPYWDLE